MSGNLKVVCVYKTGGDFSAEYVEKIYEVLCHYDFICLTDADDVPSNIPQMPLWYGWKNWWSKMELFNPSYIKSDILYFDLDTLFVYTHIKEMHDLCKEHDRMIMLSDFYRPNQLASGVMFIPHKDKYLIWDEFIQNVKDVIFHYHGDQDFISYVIYKYRGIIHVDRWDKVLPNYIASYKAHLTKEYPNNLKPLEVDITQSNVICFHGKPRPKDINWKM